ncbi:MAG: hypothetical protein IJ002_07015 [Clostridia bacterium]|nr:hypothetical protein [Clostridia bacterium]
MSEPNLNDILSGGGLSSLLQNPEVAAKLPRIMEALGPVMAEMRAEQNTAGVGESPSVPAASTDSGGEKQGGDAQQASGANPADILAALPAMSGGGKGKNQNASRRRALLCALEPYLSESRREAVGYISRVLTLIDILSEVM